MAWFNENVMLYSSVVAPQFEQTSVVNSPGHNFLCETHCVGFPLAVLFRVTPFFSEITSSGCYKCCMKLKFGTKVYDDGLS
jgi:hypothetical protein